MAEPSLQLSTGAKMPMMAFGMLMEDLNPDHHRVVKIVENALAVGYRHFDAAQIYGTESMLGEAVKNSISKGSIKRQDVFITTKLWRNSYGKEDVVPSLKKSLAALQMDYVDLFLIHWPTAYKSGEDIFPTDAATGKRILADIDPLETWRGMEECYKSGLARAIGVSNFNHKQLQKLLDNSSIKPANNQIESHPYLSNTKLVKFCQDRGITIMAYAPLAGFNAKGREEKGWPTIFTDETIKRIADKHKKTPAQVALRYQIERQVAVAPKSAKVERMKENFDAITFQLDANDMAALHKCDHGYRLNDEHPEHPHYPFNEEF